MLKCLSLACLIALFRAVPGQAQRPPIVFDTATNISIRFLHTLESGRDTVGEGLLVQTLSPLALPGCVAVPAYVRLAGHITSSQAGGRFGRRGEFEMVFDSIQAQLGDWLPLHGVLDTLEYIGALPKDGEVFGQHHSAVRRASTAGAIAAAASAAVEELPAALLGTYWALRNGPRAVILAGETGSISLTQPFRVRASHCEQTARLQPAAPALPPMLPHATSGDPINFVLIGDAAQLDSAFHAAGWRKAARRKPASIAKSVFTTLTALPASNPPVSNQFLFGRSEDVTYELEGPNARIRHHIRIWRMDGQPNLWVGAATLDDGLSLSKRTHRVDPNIDNERGYLVRDLEAGGRARLSEYVTLPGAQNNGELAHGQRYVSDGKAAVIELLN